MSNENHKAYNFCCVLLLWSIHASIHPSIHPPTNWFGWYQNARCAEPWVSTGKTYKGIHIAPTRTCLSSWPSMILHFGWPLCRCKTPKIRATRQVLLWRKFPFLQMQKFLLLLILKRARCGMVMISRLPLWHLTSSWQTLQLRAVCVDKKMSTSFSLACFDCNCSSCSRSQNNLWPENSRVPLFFIHIAWFPKLAQFCPDSNALRACYNCSHTKVVSQF